MLRNGQKLQSCNESTFFRVRVEFESLHVYESSPSLTGQDSSPSPAGFESESMCFWPEFETESYMIGNFPVLVQGIFHTDDTVSSRRNVTVRNVTVSSQRLAYRRFASKFFNVAG